MCLQQIKQNDFRFGHIENGYLRVNPYIFHLSSFNKFTGKMGKNQTFVHTFIRLWGKLQYIFDSTNIQFSKLKNSTVAVKALHLELRE